MAKDKANEMTLEELVKTCKAEFDELQAQLGNTDGQDAVAAGDERARFNVWIDTVSPEPFFGISKLDYQLRDSQSLRERLKGLLKKLVRILQQARERDADKKERTDIRERHDPAPSQTPFANEEIDSRESLHELRSREALQDEARLRTQSVQVQRREVAKRDAQIAQDDEAWASRRSPLPDRDKDEIIVRGGRSDMSPAASKAHDSVLSYQEVLDDLEVPKSSQQARQIQRARRIIDMLLRLAETVRKPALDERLMSSALVAADSRHDLDVEQVTAQFPGISPYLAERLGKAISKRRQYFIYKAGDSDENHAVPGQQADREDSIPDSVSVDDDHARTGIDEEFTSPPPGTEIELDLPPMPKEGTPSKCPLCGEVFNPTDPDFWVFHLEDDLRPYLCTWKDCSIGPHLYHRRRDWQRHEDTAHRRTWKCPFECDSAYETPSEFSEHLKTAHEANEDPEILKSLIEASSRPSEPSKDLRCPLCESRIATLDRWYRHVGQHLEYLSYFSLPDRLRRVKSEADEVGVGWVSSSLVNEQDVTGEARVTNVSNADRNPRQAMVESEDTEQSDKLSEAGASVTDGRLETLELDEGVRGLSTIEVRGRSRSVSVDSYPPREQSPISVEVVSESSKVVERSRSRESVVEKRGAARHYPGRNRESHKGKKTTTPQDLHVSESISRQPRNASPTVEEQNRVTEYDFLGRDDGTHYAVHRHEDRNRAPTIHVYNRDRSPTHDHEDMPSYVPYPTYPIENAGMEAEKLKDEQAKIDRERQHKEFVEEYELRKAKQEMERKEIEARIEREYEEKKYKRERGRKELEEKIRLEMRREEEKKKDEDKEFGKKVEEKMWKKLAAFGFQDHQIRSIVEGDQAEKSKSGFYEDNFSFEREREIAEREFADRERQYHAQRRDREPLREYYAPSQEYSNPPREHRAGGRPPQPAARLPTDYEDYLEPIRFEDAEYRRYRIPFKAARTWKGMQKVVREVYQNSEIRDMDEDIISGRWQIVDADDNGILPSSWEMSVKPGYVYKLAFTRPQQNDRMYERDRYNDERTRLNDDVDEIIGDHRPWRSRSPVIIRETPREPVQERDAFRSVDNAANPFQPPEPQPQPPTTGNPEYAFYRRRSRSKPTKAVSWDPYLDDEAGWYPNLESATRGGFQRPGKEPTPRPWYRDNAQQTASYAYPPPPPPNSSGQYRGPTWVKAHRDHISPETLRYYDLPWEYDMNDNNYIIIQRDMEPRETDILFEHTRRLRERPAVTAGPSAPYPVYR
ncbi:hypothetical protein M409DRAFT_25263 [Zasmidium cellare ATCC 36951]|uniref:C2H2-type domain-containing protein n=1 Tax=Zasmidium cellare ATCC 36951 TaxID=1080233 RepID=A0A6A6CBF9_ZASCE|nr:uncharacterized protein M409DRAFT_25263 [Zasmidium cellare ATCC 36951]KAF2164385.1 hypothetical protein M409DRAFT_25263 [Zasmidium cellare ATCC 36951]